MVGRSRKRRVRQAVSGTHQRCWLWGRHLVMETLEAGVWPVLEIWLDASLPADETRRVLDLAQAKQIRSVQGPRSTLGRLCAREDHQGYLAKMAPFPYADLQATRNALSSTPVTAVLDAVQDPFNFGAILRSAEVFGVEAVFVGRERQADVSSHVARASAGAVNRIPIVATDLVSLLTLLRTSGHQVLGASEKASLAIDACDLTRPTVLVIGNEGHGLQRGVQSACTSLVTIPQHGSLNSLNAAAAAAVLFYEVQRQRHPSPRFRK